MERQKLDARDSCTIASRNRHAVPRRDPDADLNLDLDIDVDVGPDLDADDD